MNKKLLISLDDLFEVTPLTKTQELFFKHWHQHLVHVCYGSAGTGKTLLALAAGLPVDAFAPGGRSVLNGHQERAIR